MKRILYIITAVILIGACKKSGNQIDNSVPLADRIPGKWDITKVEYTGYLPVGGGWLPISGEGENVDGEFNFTTVPNVGEFNIQFLAKINAGVGPVFTVDVDESHYGEWEPIQEDRFIKMWRNDTIYNWEVLNNTQNRQVWKTAFVFDFGTGYDSIPVDVKATIER